MREKDLEKLGFFQILERLKSGANCPATKELIDLIRPIQDLEALERERKLLTEALERLDMSLHPFEDIRDIIKRSQIKDHALSVEEILKLLQVIRLMKDVRRKAFESLKEDSELNQVFRSILTFQNLENQIEASIDPRGFVKDSASEELRRVRQSIRAVEKEVLKRIDQILSRPDAEKVFSDRFVAFRSGRYVLPVKTSELKKVIGVVHGTSSSGFTTFVEPQSVIELNNEIVSLREQEEEQIKKVLRGITASIGENSKKIEESFRALVKLDYLIAVKSFSKDLDAKIANFGSFIELISVRHPLLPKDTAVPIDIILKDKKGLIITGPNTGGKTVSLKTLGLCSVMNQCALPIPAKSATLPFFKGIYVDIGDEQSIEQSLSTFSAHIKNICEFLPEADSDTLVLIDELGSGTDPFEGSALGIALLEYFKSRNAFCVITTHQSPIKLFALGSNYYMPASTLFDLETLKPLYQLAYGIVGESMALKVAENLGLPKDILLIANRYLPEGFVDYHKAREELQKTLEEMKAELEEKIATQQRLNQELEKTIEELKEQKRREIQEAISDLSRRFEEFISKAESKKVQDITRLKQEFYSQVIPPPENIKVGDMVEFRGAKGKVIEIQGQRAFITLGNTRAWVPIYEIKKTDIKPALTREDVNVYRNLPQELSLIGLSVQEALVKLELYIQEANSLGIKSFKIIHGHSGLKRAIQEFLSNCELVLFHREGYPHEGGPGTSVVYLKRD